MTVKRRQSMRQFVVARNFFHEFVVLAVMLDRGFTHETASLNAEMFLRDREWVFLSDFRNSDALDPFAIGDDEVWISSRAQKISIEASLFADRPGLLTPVTKRYRH